MVRYLAEPTLNVDSPKQYVIFFMFKNNVVGSFWSNFRQKIDSVDNLHVISKSKDKFFVFLFYVTRFDMIVSKGIFQQIFIV